jgi:hypothetical protein
MTTTATSATGASIDRRAGIAHPLVGRSIRLAAVILRSGGCLAAALRSTLRTPPMVARPARIRYRGNTMFRFQGSMPMDAPSLEPQPAQGQVEAAKGGTDDR